ncbi:hemolysin, partial [Pseudoalteromonas ruthenica]|uniref:calcium-binding protein n=1 Tax=Pseudoalteromonas ruthenica TaxID=151081 RepID=UPI001289153C
AFFGYGGDDVINTGLGNNYVDGGDGNDTIKVVSSSAARDYENELIGGKGDDRLEGHAGADSYIYRRGDGNDVIMDNGRGSNQVDRLVFGEGIELADISLRKEGSNMVVVVADANNGEDSQIVIQGALANSVYRIEEMVFADGRVIRGDWLEHFTLNVLGDEQANTLDGSNDDNAFFGYGG